VIAFGNPLRESIQANLNAHTPLISPLDGRRHAAVAIVLVDSDTERHDDDPIDSIDMSMVPGDLHDEGGKPLDGRMLGVAGGAAFLLCRRATRMTRHAGQWALPGGRLDADENPVEGALRELREELGLSLSTSELLGRLDDYPTRSGYVITPVVLWGPADPQLVPAPDEVQAVYRIGLQPLLASDPRFITISESDRPVLQLPLGHDLIHAPTAAIIYQFRQVALLGHTDERVHHLGEPVFAWR
jgi:8-oxo-dGTP pyrophosphatase MutT (NUDIX family)